MSQLQEFGDEIWTMDGDTVHMFAIPFATRMTIIRLESKGLWVHSPIMPTPERIDEVRALGDVEHIVAPNRLHSLGVEPWQRLFPKATVWVSPRFTESHSDISVDCVFHECCETGWESDVEHLLFAGNVYLDEVVFLHHKSGTVIMTDLIQRHVPSRNSVVWRMVKRSAGVLGEEGGVSLDLKASFVDTARAMQSKEALLSWDFDQLIIAHGYCVHENAKEFVEHSLSWL